MSSVVVHEAFHAREEAVLQSKVNLQVQSNLQATDECKPHHCHWLNGTLQNISLKIVLYKFSNHVVYFLSYCEEKSQLPKREEFFGFLFGCDVIIFTFPSQVLVSSDKRPYRNLMFQLDRVLLIVTEHVGISKLLRCVTWKLRPEKAVA